MLTDIPQKKFFLSIPILLFSVFIYGQVKEHGDSNVAGMYVVVFFIHTMIIATISYLTYFITTNVTRDKRINFLKNYAHFIWVIIPFFVWANIKYLIWTELVIIGLINTLGWLIRTNDTTTLKEKNGTQQQF